MDPLEMHRRSQEVFAGVLARVTDDQLSSSTPCDDWDVADLVDHVVAGNLAVHERLGGPAATAAPLEGDRTARFEASSDLADAAFSAAGVLDRLVALPFAEIPVRVWVAIRSGDLYVHAWDLAVAIGSDTDLDPELGEAIRAATAPLVSPELRGDGRPFGVELACDSDRPVADRYAAFLGRHVGQ